jgi:ABC-2 type transport system permease protein
MRNRGHVIAAIVRRELAGYFSTPTGYVFISLFVFLSAVAAFWQDRFFANNLANLDQLNRFFPYLLVFFIPAISMSLWADERRQGTEELLLTLPTSDVQVVLGKYFAGVAIYTVSLLFSLSHVVVLQWLGKPDPGLIVATYAGYWLAGAALLAVAMLASLLSDNLTVAFIVGGMFCAVLVFLDQAGAITSGALQRLAEKLSVVEQLRDLLAGAVTLNALVYFAGVTVAALYLNTALLGRRRWPTGPKAPRFAGHYLLRTAALAAAVGSLTVLVSQARIRWDATSEQIHSLSPGTVALLKGLDRKQPVFIYAYFSPDVPRSYVDARNSLVGMLREFDAAGGEAIHSRIIETVKYSPAAREAEERYNIRPYRIPATEESAGAMNEIFLGLVFTRGSEEFVIPFFDRGLPAEYELVRSIRVVSRAKRKEVGILNTPVQLFGGYDFQSKRQSQEWSIVAELRKQYEVVQVPPDTAYPGDLDVLLAAQPSALTQPQADRLADYLKTGKPVLLLLDPMPAFNLELAPLDVQQQASPFQAQQPPPSPKANLKPMLEAAGVTWQPNRIRRQGLQPKGSRHGWPSGDGAALPRRAQIAVRFRGPGDSAARDQQRIRRRALGGTRSAHHVRAGRHQPEPQAHTGRNQTGPGDAREGPGQRRGRRRRRPHGRAVLRASAPRHREPQLRQRHVPAQRGGSTGGRSFLHRAPQTAAQASHAGGGRGAHPRL